MTTQEFSQQTVVRRELPTLALIGLGGSWIAFALAETVIGELDALHSAAELAANGGRVTTAGLLHIVAAVLLTYALMGLVGQGRRNMPARAGALLCGVLAPCLGAFGMLHLLALEMNDSGLERLQGFGAWGLPVFVAAFLGPFLLLLLLAGLARGGEVPWWAAAVVGVGAVLHFFSGSGVVEVVSHWLIAAGMVAGALRLAHR
ncbi:hypothetical protein [Ornithinicoccus halotolerans]|uniref:hypothetical protein n=1 Tax=Ornithinicoccus halotolerans TaxID=1748220 RepID=UPI001296FFDF|nr:hypothetical protein [Ornithinicoccus halotolerans]